MTDGTIDNGRDDRRLWRLISRLPGCIMCEIVATGPEMPNHLLAAGGWAGLVGPHQLGGN